MKLITPILVGCSFLLSGIVFANNHVVSKLTGELNIEQGNASYTIPIAAAKGRAGLQPHIGLQYNSDAQGGILGTGWKLSGITAISACPNSKYCLDGTKLILLKGKYGDTNSEYRLETDNYSRITKQDNYWQVDTKDGQTYTFGNDANSRYYAGKYHADNTWLISDIHDKHNNIIKFSYHQSSGLIKQIEYVGGKLEFIYQDKLLQQIKIYAQDNLWLQYVLTYQIDSTSTLLTTIKQCDAANQCLPPLEFSYHQTTSENIGFNTPTDIDFDQVIVSTFKDKRNGVVMGDFNGDTYPDIIKWDSRNHKQLFLGQAEYAFRQAVTLNITEIFSTRERTRSDKRAGCPRTVAGDFNGDGRDDILVAKTSSGAVPYTYPNPMAAL